MRRRYLVTGALTALISMACGSTDGNEAFCQEITIARQLLSDASYGSTDDMATIVDELDEISPPEAIESPYQRLLDLYTTIAETGSITDPAISSELADSQADLAEVDAYVAEECNPDKAH
jgi:hypothetical protein